MLSRKIDKVLPKTLNPCETDPKICKNIKYHCFILVKTMSLRVD